ncbi:MAG: UDP-N-acetylmuramate--L-alanine ligase [Ruminococcaceae bacterium]|nr:UDP-N-acetylmuramate--L-alanine ligase [Oscillospiraceae bacterium]
MYKCMHTREEIESILKNSKNIFFIGIGGVSMSSLAHISAKSGFCVSGSDRTESDVTKALEECGVKVFYKHCADNVKGADAVVYTAAIRDDNPELVYAGENSIPIIYRADYLGYIMSKHKNRIGISGMHGKSTATSMTSLVFLEAGVDPTVVSGAKLNQLEGGAYRTGSKEHFIMEACEYCDSFLSFTPNIAVVLNVEMDHPDYFKDLDQIKSSFSRFVSIADEGCAVVNWDDENVRETVRDYKGRLVKFGRESQGLDYTAENIRYEGAYPVFDIKKPAGTIENIKLCVTGEHNIMNALAAAAVADICGIGEESIRMGLAKYTGAARRMEYKGKICAGKADMYEDYAHHPTEIRATLKGAKKLAAGTLWCVYQPHTYSRTAELFDEFTSSFGGVKTIFADIFAARETNTTGISSKDLADKTENSVYIDSFEGIVMYLRANVKEGETVIIMGAGDINKVCGMLKEE